MQIMKIHSKIVEVFMNRSMVVRCMTVCFIWVPCYVFSGQGGNFRPISDMCNDLVRMGAYSYVTSPSTPKLAPHIHSQNWVDWLPDTEVRRKMFEQDKREFGLAFVGELEKCAERQMRLKNYADVEQESWKMLEIAQWLKTSPGYGNCFLAHWAENLALNLVGKMAVSPAMNTNSVNRLLQRLGACEADLRFRVSVLNDEAPEEFLLPKTSDPDVAFNSFMRQWGIRRNAAMKHFGPMAMMRISWRDVSEDDRDYGFLLDDDCPAELSLRGMWGRKLHSVICSMSPEFYRIKVIRNILRYREQVGSLSLPNELQVTDKKAGSEYAEDVDSRWTNKMSMKYGPNCTGLWTLVICKGEFVDQWTSAYIRKDGDGATLLASSAGIFK